MHLCAVGSAECCVDVGVVKTLGAVRAGNNWATSDLRSAVGMGQVVFGSDYPYLRRDLAVNCRREIEKSEELDIEGVECRSIVAGNALKLFPQLAACVPVAQRIGFDLPNQTGEFMTYSVIGAGNIGSAVARQFARKGMDIAVANTRGPTRLFSSTRNSVTT